MIWNVILEMQVKRKVFSATPENKKRNKKNWFPEVCSQAATVCEALRKHHLSPKCVQQQKQLKPAAAIQPHYA